MANYTKLLENIKLIDEEAYKKICNLELCDRDKEYYNFNISISDEYALIELMCWDETNQGHKYWEDINQKLQEFKESRGHTDGKNSN